MSAGSVLLVDSAVKHRNELGRAMVTAGWDVWLTDDVASAAHVLETRQPTLVVTEARFPGGTWRDVVSRVDRQRTRVIIATDHIAVASAIAAIKRGVENVLIKPVNACTLLSVVGGRLPIDDLPHAAAHPSLDRTIYEILSQAVEAAGTIAGAARLLRLDRRSLRRMLQKNPPPV